MVECIFTLDYEIYGNGEGSLSELVLEPGRELKALFHAAGQKLVVFFEAAEFEKIERHKSDDAITAVLQQVREFHEEGHEIALHLHPQWCNASYNGGRWLLDYAEYNLCRLPEQRIEEIISSSVQFVRRVIGDPGFTPLSFRAGNWLFQPTHTAATVLARHGIRVDSSVFKGGRQHQHGLDYRGAAANEAVWRFGTEVTEVDPSGSLLEVPIHTTMVPSWKMITTKRVGLQRKGATRSSLSTRFFRTLDLLRVTQPMKFDFCRMTLRELTAVVDKALAEDVRADTDSVRPLVAIGHTKDLTDPGTVKSFLAYLEDRKVAVSTLADFYQRHQARAARPDCKGTGALALASYPSEPAEEL